MKKKVAEMIERTKKGRPVLPLAAGLTVCILMLAFIMMPFPASGLTLRLYFGGFSGDNLNLYYATDENPGISADQICVGTYDAENNLATIRLTPELADHLIQIRLDFPGTDQVLSVRNISVSSAGVIQHHYNPCDFFSERNIIAKNDVPQIDLVESRQLAYIQTSGADPYIVFDSALVRDLLRYRSSYRMSRLAACILILLGYTLYRIRPFAPKNENEIP